MKESTTEAIWYYLCGTHYFRLQAEELRDAAEFEARVAAKLATVPILGCNSNCPWNKMDPQNSFGCIHEYERRFCRLRNARLAVEEEMDG